MVCGASCQLNDVCHKLGLPFRHLRDRATTTCSIQSEEREYQPTSLTFSLACGLRFCGCVFSFTIINTRCSSLRSRVQRGTPGVIPWPVNDQNDILFVTYMQQPLVLWPSLASRIVNFSSLLQEPSHPHCNLNLTSTLDCFLSRRSL